MNGPNLCVEVRISIIPSKKKKKKKRISGFSNTLPNVRVICRKKNMDMEKIVINVD